MEKIKNKWEKYYNLPEIEKVREIIKNTYSNRLEFIEESHQYFLDGQEYLPVSTTIHHFVDKDSRKMAEMCYKKGLKDPNYKYAGMSVDEILALWKEISDKACGHGTITHEFGESLFYWFTGHPEKILESSASAFVNGKPEPRNGVEKAILSFWEEIPENIVPILSETKVFNTEGTQYAGTFDILFYYVQEPESPKNGLVIGDYKGLPLDYPILTTNGWKTMGTLSTEDKVYDKNGKPSKILHISDVHYNDCYEITLSNNEKIVADKDHRWEVFFHPTQSETENVVLTTMELLDCLSNKKRPYYGTPKIHVANKIENKKRNLPIDPYILGVWLITENSDKIPHKLKYKKEVWEEVKRRKYCTNNTTTLNANGKISEIYFLSSIQQRIDLLRGFMDSAGYYSPKNKHFGIILHSENLCNDVFSLISSLGIKPSRIKDENTKRKRWIITFKTIDFDPFFIRSKKYDGLTKTPRSHYFNIKKIEKVETVPTKCIEVDSETHTYLCGRNFIVTHNTNGSTSEDKNKAKNKMYENYQGKKLLPPFDNMLDCDYSIYTLQLACYQIPMENVGLKVLGRRLIWVHNDGAFDKISLDDKSKEMRKALNIPSKQICNKIIKEKFIK